MAYPYDLYPTDREATSALYSPSTRISNPRGGSARPATATRATPGANTFNPQSAFSQSLHVKPDAAGWMGVGASTAGAALGAYGMTQQRNQYSNINPSTTDMYSTPVYTAGQAQNEVAGTRAHGASGGEIANSAMQGFTAGLATGNPLVAGGAAVVNAGITAIGGAVRKNKQQRELNAKTRQVASAQNQYNQDAEEYRQRQNQLYDYYNQNNAEGREYNVLRSRMIA